MIHQVEVALNEAEFGAKLLQAKLEYTESDVVFLPWLVDNNKRED